MKRNLLIGLSLLCFVACKDKTAAPAATTGAVASDDGDDDGDDNDHAAEPGRRRRGHWGGGFCKKATDEQWTALQKCNEKLPAELKAAHDQCNTQVFGAAAPTKEQACDKEKRRAAMKCVREKNVKADREARKEHFMCMMGVMRGAGEN